MELEQRIERLEGGYKHTLEEIQTMQNLAKELNMWKTQNLLENTCQQVDRLSTQLSELTQRLKSFEGGKFIETFSDDEIKGLYLDSGLNSQDVKEFIKKLNGEEVTMATVSRYVNAQIEDLTIRCALARFFRYSKELNANRKARTVA